MIVHPPRDAHCGAMSEAGSMISEHLGWRVFGIRAGFFMLLFWMAFFAFVHFSNFAMPGLIAFFALIMSLAFRQQGNRAPSLRAMRLRRIQPGAPAMTKFRKISQADRSAAPLEADNDR